MLLLTVGNHEEGKTDVYVCVSDRSVLLPKHNYITFLSSSVIKENKWSTTTQLLFFFLCVCCLFTSNFRVVKDKERKGKKKRSQKSKKKQHTCFSSCIVLANCWASCDARKESTALANLFVLFCTPPSLRFALFFGL